MDETVKKYRLRHPRCRYCKYLEVRKYGLYDSFVCMVRNEQMARQRQGMVSPDFDYTMKLRLFCSSFKLRE